MGQTWKPVVGYEGLYEVSDTGLIRSWHIKNPGKILTASEPTRRKPYPTVGLCRGGRKKNRRLHSLVMEAFVGPRPPGFATRHLDGNPANNKVENLAYGTMKENSQDAIRHGTLWQLAVTRCRQGHPYDEENTYRSSRRPGRRYCRACMRASNRAYLAKRRLASLPARATIVG